MVGIDAHMKWKPQYVMGFFLLFLTLGCSEKNPLVVTDTQGQITPPSQPETTVPVVTVASTISPIAPSRITHMWANDGGDKVTRDELRATQDPDSVGNIVWDGTQISLFGAHNEVVAFNLILEAPEQSAANVMVTLDRLHGPQETSIATQAVNRDNLFDYVERNIELFYVRYLEIKGLSTDLFFRDSRHGEQHIPQHCRRPNQSDGGWQDRPCHNKLYPEIAVPLSLEAPFTIPAGTNQSIWGDIYIPKGIPAGIYSGQIAVLENGTLTWQIPIELSVFDFELPDLPNARTMLFISRDNINDRYLGEGNIYLAPSSEAYSQARTIVDRHFQLAHRHKISLIDGYTPLDRIDTDWGKRLTGELFTPAQGYAGIGTGVGNNIYAIGTYGSWPWQGGSRDEMWANSDAWVNWFEAHSFTTPTDYFLYLIDESEEYAQTERWARWLDENPGPGQRLVSMATLEIAAATAYTPSLDIAAIGAGSSVTIQPDTASRYAMNPHPKLFLYNGNRPVTGSFAIEDEGIALWVLGWVQYKMKIDRWFYWESTYYNNFQGNTGQTNVFRQAQTFGNLSNCCDDILGETGWNYRNGGGVLFYPGTDTRYPENSYGVQGPLASLRLKQWRRGIQDADYLAMAAEVDPERVARIVSRIIPRVLWETGLSTSPDTFDAVSWPIAPDVWTAARIELARIIEGASMQH